MCFESASRCLLELAESILLWWRLTIVQASLALCGVPSPFDVFLVIVKGYGIDTAVESWLQVQRRCPCNDRICDSCT